MDLSDSSGSLSWYELSDIQNILRKYALVQLLRMFQKHKNRRGDCFLWGDEVGYNILFSNRINLDNNKSQFHRQSDWHDKL